MSAELFAIGIVVVFIGICIIMSVFIKPQKEQKTKKIERKRKIYYGSEYKHV